MQRPLEDYLNQTGNTKLLTIYEHDKARFDELQRRLVVLADGHPVTQAMVMALLLDTHEELYRRLGDIEE
jgi:hypothetical protein